MKELLITRNERLGENWVQGTRGIARAFDDGVLSHTWYSGELPWIDLDENGVRDSDVSCAPQGSFTAKYTLSPKRSTPGNPVYVYQLQNVPGAIALQIHSGNFFGEVNEGWDSNVEGCILLGKGKGQLRNSKDVMQEAITGSKTAISEFMAWANKEDIKVTIKEDFPDVGEVSPEVN